ncbi:formyltransferase family protein [Cytobacillus dafuensis]|nr:formyltransferase family protein [Cytobacillus dafuensis]
MREAIFFGSNYKILQIINRKIPIKKVFCESENFNLDLYNFTMLHSIPIEFVSKKGDIQFHTNENLGISCGFGLIFNKMHIQSFKNGIWNIHYGKLPSIRSRHPISWAFLLGEKELWVSIHEINEKIDQGYLLAKGKVYRDLNDSHKEIEEKFESLIEAELLEQAVKNYLNNKKELLVGELYYENLINKFVSISPEDYDSTFLFHLFKSQKKYGGVKIQGRTYTTCHFFNRNFKELYEGYSIFTCKDGVKIGIR